MEYQGVVISVEVHMPEKFKPDTHSKGKLSDGFRKADQGQNYSELTEEHVFNYGLKDGAENIGQISRTNETDDARNTGPDSKSKKEKFRQLIEKITNDFYNDMIFWSLSDFKEHGQAYRDWLNEKASDAYENEDYETFQSLSEQAELMYKKEQNILSNMSLSEEEKKLVLIELWKEQDPKLVEEFIAEYKTVASDVAIEKKNSFDDNIKNPEVETLKDSTTIPGLKI